MAYGDNQASTDINATYGSTAGASVFVPELWSKGVKGYFEKPTTLLKISPRLNPPKARSSSGDTL